MLAPESTSPLGGGVHRLLVRQPSARVLQHVSYIHNATLLVMREILLLCISSNAAALVVAVVYGWATPFANSTTAYDREGFALWIVLCCCLFGMLAVSPLVAHVLRSPTLSTIQATWLLLRRSRLAIVLYSALGPALVFGLLHAGVPLIHLNAHSAISTLVTTLGAMQLMANAVSIHHRRRFHVTAIHPVVDNTRAKQKPSWKKTLRKASSLMVPSALSAVLTTQYVMLARQIHFTSSSTLLLFCLGSTLLKTLLPIATKLFITKSHIRNSRNSLFMLVAPIMHVEIQMRMAVMRAYQQSTPIYVSSAMVNVLEIVMRVATVTVDIGIVHRARQRKDREQLVAVQARAADGDADDAAKNEALAARLQELESAFNKWKHEHLRNCSNEILAEMAAEYCSIAVVVLYMVVLHGNRSLDMPVASATSMRERISEQTTAWATQVAFEIVTDAVAIFIEMRAGIPLLGTLQQDRERFLRWVIPVVVVHACGLCLSSLVVFV